MPATEQPRQRRAFSLIELLVVMVIIAIVIAIIVPAVGGARIAARVTATKSLMTDFGNAAGQYEQDRGSTPAYFPVRDVGADLNGTLSMMENAILALSGGIVEAGAGDGIPVGPYGDNRDARVNPGLIGSDIGGQDVYFVPPAKFFIAQGSGSQDGVTGDRLAMPDLCDAFGVPMLLWMPDEGASQPITQRRDFVAEVSGTNPARFYRQTNRVFLDSVLLGRTGKNQADEDEGTLLADDDHGLDALVALTGHPGFPKNLEVGYHNILPTAPRGQMIVHAAGPDGVFLGKYDRKGRTYAQHLYYGLNFFLPGSDGRLVDDSGKPTSTDIIRAFDDIVVSRGGSGS